MDKSWNNICIALAGVCQCCSLVEQLAKTGYLNTEDFETAVNSLFQRNPDSPEAVFGHLSRLTKGLEVLNRVLEDHRRPGHTDIIRYMLGIFHLQKRLSKRRDMLHIIATRLEKAENQVVHFGPAHENVVSNIASIYTDTLSTFQQRIRVTGEYNYLQQKRVADQIRVLLLAAIRAATLWRQVGGSRWHLLFYRRNMEEATADLLQRAKHEQLNSR